MIAAWMAYAFLVAALAAGSAWILERLLRSHRRPTRGLWAGAMGLAALWPIWTALRPVAEPATSGLPPGIPLVAFEPLTLQVGASSIWMTLDRPLLLVWILSSSLLVTFGFGLLLRVRRLKARWRGETAGGLDVLVSEDWGPAVVGLLRPQIVLPEWCRGMGEEGLRLILDHEAEHMEAGDLRLLVMSGIVPVLLPWSLPVWWIWHRLRLAVEGDCDLRVLRRNPRATRAYMELLMEVGRRLPQGRAVAAMLSEPERTLVRRIRTMTMPIPERPLLRGTLLVAIGAILIVVACAVPTPMALRDDTALPATEPLAEEGASNPSEIANELPGQPTFTPFTDPPGILNREDVSVALQAQYPPLLKDAGVEGTVRVWVFIDQTGVVRRTILNETSGHEALDNAALRVAESIRFTAARNRGEPVPVWIALPITFSLSGDGASHRSGPEAVPPEEAPRAGTNDMSPQTAIGLRRREEIAESPTFTPFTVRPDITNRAAVGKAMEAEYPPLLRDAGIGGTAVVWFFIDETGTVQRTLLSESSGQEALDEAALRVADQIEFTPAQNQDEPVPVWISLPITFTVR